MIRHVVLWKLKPEAAAPEVLAQNLAQHDPDSRAFCELVRERKAVIDFEIQENQ